MPARLETPTPDPETPTLKHGIWSDEQVTRRSERQVPRSAVKPPPSTTSFTDSDDILEKLLALNLELAEKEKRGEPVTGTWAPPTL